VALVCLSRWLHRIPTWPERFETARAELLAATGPVVVRVEHIGSTSVPGLAAQTGHDMMASVRGL
jgi:GrpB-like predicted nucleotidyltransferase (UPF0157 family)